MYTGDVLKTFFKNKIYIRYINQEEQKSIYEKKIADQLDVPYKTLREQMPIAPEWGVKCNSEGKNLNWYGYKGHSQWQHKANTFLVRCFHLEAWMTERLPFPC